MSIGKKVYRIALLVIVAIAACICMLLFVGCDNDNGKYVPVDNVGDNEAHTTHTLITYIYNNDATCEKDGTETAVCEECKIPLRRHSQTQLKTGQAKEIE